MSKKKTEPNFCDYVNIATDIEKNGQFQSKKISNNSNITHEAPGVLIPMDLATLESLMIERLPSAKDWENGAAMPSWIPKESVLRLPKKDRSGHVKLYSDTLNGFAPLDMLSERIECFSWVTRSYSISDRASDAKGDRSGWGDAIEVPASIVKEHWPTSEQPIWGYNGRVIDGVGQDILEKARYSLEASEKQRFCEKSLELFAVVSGEALNKAFSIVRQGAPEKHNDIDIMTALEAEYGIGCSPTFKQAENVLGDAMPSKTSYYRKLKQYRSRIKKS